VRECICENSSVVEHDLAKVGVAGSNPVSRSKESKDPQETESIHIGSVFLFRETFMVHDQQAQRLSLIVGRDDHHLHLLLARKKQHIIHARMVELVDTQDLKSCGHCGRAGSIPAPGTLRETFVRSSPFFF
jgi:hypothetical protein